LIRALRGHTPILFDFNPKLLLQLIFLKWRLLILVEIFLILRVQPKKNGTYMIVILGRIKFVPPDSTPSPTLAPLERPSEPREPLELAAPPSDERGSSVEARLIALTKFDENIPHEDIIKKTGVSRSGLYKLRSKAASRGWRPGELIETWHIGRTKTSTATALFIIEAVTKNSATRG
jgi:hypothetical protein